jgi:simple sugar transport system ATP-binding protein
VHSGEILSVVGVAGNGQRELAEALTGLRRVRSGSIHINDRDLTRGQARDYIKAGLGHIPEDRMGVGLVPTEPIWRNAILKAFRHDAEFSRGPVLRRLVARKFARRLGESVKLSTLDVETRVQHLSGGNAQRLLTGRELATKSLVAVVAVEPAHGLDVNAQADVWRALLRARQDGIAVLLVSGDLDETLAISDRIAVLYEGQLIWEGNAAEADRVQIGLLMGGATQSQTGALPQTSSAS